MNKDKILALHNSILEKLELTIEGTTDFKSGQLTNPMAACLIRSVIGDVILMQAEFNRG